MNLGSAGALAMGHHRPHVSEALANAMMIKISSGPRKSFSQIQNSSGISDLDLNPPSSFLYEMRILDLPISLKIHFPMGNVS